MKKLFLTISLLLAFLLFESFSPWLSPVSAQKIRIAGQVAPDAEEEIEKGQKQTIFPAPPREFRRAMEDAKKLMEMERYAEAVRQLDQILSSDEDFFYLAESSGNGGGEVFRNLKQEAEQILETFPPKGLELYEVEFGTTARLLLNDGLEQGKMELVAQAANRFFFTKAGSEAAFLQGLDLLERQQPAAAREVFLKLRSNPRLSNRFEPILTLYLASADFELGNSDEATQLLADGRKSQAAAWNALKIGGKPLAEAIPNGASAHEFAAWLKNQVPVLARALPEDASRDWTFLLQNQARCTDAGKFSMPILTPCWRVSMIDDPEGTVILALLAHGTTNLPLHAPLVVGNTALMRTAWNLTAIDLQTGKKLWVVPTMDYEAVREVLNQAPYARTTTSQLAAEATMHQSMMDLLKHQIYGEEAFATLASDGKLVFCVEDSIQRFLPKRDSLMNQRFNPRIQVQPVQVRPGQAIPIQGRIQVQGGGIIMGDPQDVTDQNTVPNRLACYNIQTGKLVWHVGGQTLAQSGTMFLGAPLCVGETIYVLGQRAGTIQLLVLESQTGKLLWSQTLCLSYTDSGPTPVSCTPRLMNGMIICPTPVGALIGVNAVTHALVWGNVCGKNMEINGRQVFNSRDFSKITWGHLREIVMAEERLFYLAADNQSTRLVCLDPVTGKTLWTKENPAGFESILAVNSKEVTVKTPDRVLKLDVANGAEISKFPLPPTTGLGFRTGNSVIFPHGNTLVKYSLETLKEEASTVCHEPERLGNLIPAGEFLLSQNAKALEAFIQGDSADDWLKRTRETDSTSPEAIQVEAIRLWNDGKLPEAIALLKTGDEYTHDLMKRAILALVESKVSAKSLDSLNDSSLDWDEFYSKMETTEEKLHFTAQIVHLFLNAKRWSDALVWTRRTVDLLKDPEAAEVLIPVAEPFVSSEPSGSPNPSPENQPNSTPENRLIPSSENQPNSTSENRLKQSPDAWLASTLDWFIRELPPEDPMRAELETWAETEYAPLHKAIEDLKAEKPSFETEKKAEELVRSIARFRLRFRFWSGLKATESEFFELLKISRNFVLLESYIIQNTSSEVETGAELVRVYRELHEDSRAALALRWLERKFPNEAVLDGKTAHEWRLALPENDPVRLILDPEFTEFPTGKIEVQRTEGRGKGMMKSDGKFLHFGEYSGVCLLEGLMFRSFNPIGSTACSISCEDSLGRTLFSINSPSSQNGVRVFVNNRIRVVTHLGPPDFNQGTSFQLDWRQQQISSVYVPAIRSASEIMEEPSPNGFMNVEPSISFRVKPEPVDLGLEPYLKPIQKKLEEENLSPQSSNQYIPDVPAWSCKWDSQGGNLFFPVKDPRVLRFGLFEGELLWKKERETKYMQTTGKVKMASSEAPFIEIFKCFETPKDEIQNDGEIAGDSETLPASESSEKAEDAAASKPVDLESFVPFRILRDLTLEELQKEVSTEMDRILLRPENFSREFPTLDPQTGLPAGKIRLPQMRRTVAGDLVWGVIGNSQSPFLWNQKTQKFVWVALMNPLLREKSVPYYLDSWNIEEVSKGSILIYALNWKHQLEVFNPKTGTHLVLDFPPAAELPKGRNGKPFAWNPKNVVSCGILPDENGCFTAALSYEEYYEEPKGGSSEESADEAGDAGEESAENSGENSGENSDQKPGEDPNAPKPGENLGELLEEKTNFTGEGIMLNHALVCRFDANGKPLWEKSLFVTRSWLLEDLPVHIPVLCLQHQESSYVESSSRGSSDAQVIRFYDRRNGRLVFDGKFPVDQRLSMDGDPIKGTARMSFQKYSINFNFSSEPYSEEETVQTDESAFLTDQLRLKENELKELKLRLENNKREVEQEKKDFEKKQNLTTEQKEVFQVRMQVRENEIAEFERNIQKLEKQIEDLKKKVE